MKYNNETNLEPHLQAECRKQLSKLLDADNEDQRCYLRHWFYGALTAAHALTGEYWDLKNFSRIYYLENEDGTQRVTPNVLDRFR